MKLTLTRLIIIFIATFALTSVPSVRAQGMMSGEPEATAETQAQPEHLESIETILQDILSSQNVSTVQQLDCSKVSDSDLERLGDSVMEQNHPGAAHEAMDQMMGGEGSDSLRQMHINMGNSYLGCGNNYGYGMMGMMGAVGRNTTGKSVSNSRQSGQVNGWSMMGPGGMMAGHWGGGYASGPFQALGLVV